MTEPGTTLAPRQRTVLAVLLTQTGRSVAVDALAEFVWDGSPPARAADTLRTYVMRLRHALGDAGARIVTRDPGYLIEATEDEVDALQFIRACHDGATAHRTGQWAAASAALTSGLALWRGDPLSDIPSQLLRDAEAPALHRQRLQARQWRIEADLRLGGGEELIAELHELTALEPLREQLTVLLMTALARARRASEALALYQRTREALVSQLGIEPGPELREAQRLILAGQDPQPTIQQPVTLVPAGKSHPVPRQLPAAAGYFAGRAAELKELDSILDPAAHGAGTVTISSIGGMAGIGKTTLALHWAHRVAGRFPDGQVYVNLRGFGPAEPMAPASALRGFLGALLEPGRPLPADQDAQESLYRSLTADRKILIVLDNARDEQQVRPLLPGSASCLTLITSRSQLAGLVTTNGAIPLTLDLLTESEAYELLARRLGPERLTREPAAVGQFITTCTGLPLALSIAAARAALTPKLPLTALSEQLSRPSLDALSGPDPYADLRCVFSWSYRRLSPEAARLFRWLPLFPGPDISASAAASTDPAGRTGELLAELTGAHLLEEYVPDRFRLHDLLARYAQKCAELEDTEYGRREVRDRILAWYCASAAAARCAMAPDSAGIPEMIRPDLKPAEFATGLQALGWLEAERRNLVAAVEVAARLGFDAVAIKLPLALRGVFQVRSHWHDWEHTHLIGIGVAHRAGDFHGEAQLLSSVTHACVGLGRPEDALDGLRRALAIFQSLGDVAGQVSVHGSFGYLYAGMGRLPEAIAEGEQAVRLAREGRYEGAEGRALITLSMAYYLAAQPNQALRCMLAAQAIEAPHEFKTGLIEGDLALLYLELGRVSDAIAAASVSLERSTQAGRPMVQAIAHRALGDAFDITDRHADARSHWRAAVTLYREIGDPHADEIAAKLA